MSITHYHHCTQRMRGQSSDETRLGHTAASSPNLRHARPASRHAPRSRPTATVSTDDLWRGHLQSSRRTRSCRACARQPVSHARELRKAELYSEQERWYIRSPSRSCAPATHTLHGPLSAHERPYRLGRTLIRYVSGTRFAANMPGSGCSACRNSGE